MPDIIMQSLAYAIGLPMVGLAAMLAGSAVSDYVAEVRSRRGGGLRAYLALAGLGGLTYAVFGAAGV
ncbi:MAG: hypothetical protein AAF311_15845 [Pseudomonadota bacterium]